MNRLDVARRESGWELGDLCVDRYQGVVQAVMESLAASSYESNDNLGTGSKPINGLDGSVAEYDGAEIGAGLYPEVDLQIEWFDEPWESFWLDDLFPSTD